MKEENYGIPQLLEDHCINCYVIDALLFFISNLISAFFHYQSVISSDEL